MIACGAEFARELRGSAVLFEACRDRRHQRLAAGVGSCGLVLYYLPRIGIVCVVPATMYFCWFRFLTRLC